MQEDQEPTNFFLIKYPWSSFLQSEKCIFSLCSLVIDFACLAPPLWEPLCRLESLADLCERWKTSGQVKKNHDRYNLLMNSFHSPAQQGINQSTAGRKTKRWKKNNQKHIIFMSKNYSPFFFKIPRLVVIKYPLNIPKWDNQTWIN